MRAILTYHSIDGSGSTLSIDPRVFDSHVSWLASRRVRVVSLAELAGSGEGDDAVALTFDDGLESFATRAWPLLREHGLPVTIFVVADAVGAANEWEPPDRRLPLMSWSTLGRLCSEGVDIGSHSRSHPSLPALDDARLYDEVAVSSERIRAELGVAPSAFAYPYGDYDARVRTSVASCYRRACTTDLRALRAGEDAYALPRLDAFYFRRQGSLERWGSLRLSVRLRVRAAARSLRRVFENAMRARQGAVAILPRLGDGSA